MLLNNNQWPDVLMLDWEPTIYKLQLWRLITPFFYLGPVGLNFFLTAQFMWTYMSQLERLHYREPHTFVMLLAFGVTRCAMPCDGTKRSRQEASAVCSFHGTALGMGDQ